MIKTKLNNLHIEMQEAEHSTSSGIIVDSHDDNFISHGILMQDAFVKDDVNEPIKIIPVGSHILYSKSKHIPISEKEAIVEYHNVIGWGVTNG